MTIFEVCEKYLTTYDKQLRNLHINQEFDWQKYQL